jgi:hypothetical protein
MAAFRENTASFQDGFTLAGYPASRTITQETPVMKPIDERSARMETTWNMPFRAVQWLTAASLAGAAFLIAPEHSGHVALGWSAMGMLLIQLSAAARTAIPAPALWLATAVVLGLNLSGLLAPEGAMHTGATLATLVIAALYCATVLFESLQRLTAHKTRQAG